MFDPTSIVLLADGGPATMLLAGVIVTVIIGSFLICYFAATAESGISNDLKEHNARIEMQPDNSSPIRRYAATSDGYLPDAISALGEPEFLHRFESFAEQVHLGWLLGSSAHQHPTYISYADALVAVTPEAYTVIPWEEVTEFLHTIGFGASNGQKFLIGPDYTNYGQLYERFESEIRCSVLPQALEAIDQGKEWVFEPFLPPTTGGLLTSLIGRPQLLAPLAISKQGIRYKDQELAWSDVASLTLIRHTYNGALCSTTLSIRKNYHLSSCLEFDFKSVPNSFLLTELLPYVCPSHLLVPAGTGNNN